MCLHAVIGQLREEMMEAAAVLLCVSSSVDNWTTTVVQDRKRAISPVNKKEPNTVNEPPPSVQSDLRTLGEQTGLD